MTRLLTLTALATTLGVLIAVRPAHAEERLAVIVGSNLGGPSDDPLRYAESDARRMRDVLVSLGGVRADRALLVTGGGAARVLYALGQAQGRASELAAEGKRVVLIFYYSGHGDEGSLHLSQGRLPLTELRRALAAIPAQLRLTLLDACRTGTHEKGVGRGPAFALAASPAGPSGAIEIRASSQGELAQESEELGGSLFTHYLSSGLRGDADGDRDGQVTLGELYGYAYRRTLLRSGRTTALQHPEIIARLEGAGELVLSRPAGAGAFLEVPAGADRTLVFAQPTATVMGELSGGDASRLALPPGRFMVVRRLGSRTGAVEVDLSWGGTRRLGEGDFRMVSREELAARGGNLELRTKRVQPVAGFEVAPRGAERPALRMGGIVGQSFGTLGMEADVSVITGEVRTPGWNGRQFALAAIPQLTVRTAPGRAAFALLLGLELRWARQRLLYDHADRFRNVGFTVEYRRAYLAGGPRAGVRAGVALGGHATAMLETTVAGLIRREVDSAGQVTSKLHPIVAGVAGVAYAF